MKGVTSSGFEYDIDDTRFNSMEFVDALEEIDTNPVAVSKLLNIMFDKTQKKALYDHLRDENGAVPIDKTMTEIAEIFTNANGDAKN